MDLQSIRRQQHQQYLKHKAIEDEIEKAKQLELRRELNQIEDTINIMTNNINDIKKFDVMKVLMIVSTCLRQIECEINLINKHNKKDDLIQIFFSLVNKIILVREQYSGQIPVNELKFLKNINDNLYKIMDLIQLDRSLLDIELMDTSNDYLFAKQMHKTVNGF